MEIPANKQCTGETKLPGSIQSDVNKIYAIINNTPNKFDSISLLAFRLNCLNSLLLHGKHIKWKLKK